MRSVRFPRTRGRVFPPRFLNVIFRDPRFPFHHRRMTRRNVIPSRLGCRLGPSDPQPAINTFEQILHDPAVARDLHLHAFTALEINNGVKTPRFREDVLLDILGAGVSFGAEVAL